MEERIGIAGSGAIACGLAAAAAAHGDVVLWARSDESVTRAQGSIARALRDGDPSRVTVTQDLDALAEASFVVECVVEDHDIKAELLDELHRRLHEPTILASTTSSLSVAALAQASGRPERFVAMHVFNPVPRMALVELAFPDGASADTRQRAATLVEVLGKTAVEVPDVPGFVVNRLLFPFLFNAVALMEDTGLEPEAIDTCMKLGAGHPMGPLALLDFVGLDVALAIGEAIEADVPARLRELVAQGSLGRKSGRGFYQY